MPTRSIDGPPPARVRSFLPRHRPIALAARFTGGVILAGLACLAGAAGLGGEPASAAEWQRDWLVPGGPFRGIHGLAVAPDGAIWVGSVMGQAIYRVAPASGRAALAVAPPEGEADDLELADDGTLYFTGFMHGTLSARDPDGRIRVLARDLPGMNSLALDPRGRLFGTQVFVADALWEFDRTGKQAPRLVRKDLGGLNGFDFGPDGRLCGPLWFRRQVVCLDVDGGGTEVVADGFETPAAANFDPKGELYAIDNATGEIFHIDRETHTKKRIATAPTNLDNLAFAPDGRLFVTNMPDNAIYEVDRASGTVRSVIGSPLTLPGGIALAGGTLYVADTFALSAVELASGRVRDLERDGETSGSPSLVAARGGQLATASLHRQSAVLRDVPSGDVVAQWSALGPPTALAFGPDGQLVVATAEGVLLSLDANAAAAAAAKGASNAERAEKTADRRVLATGLAMPMGLLRTSRGWLVSEAAAGRIVELRDDGRRSTFASDLAHPEGLARLPDGRIAVAETAADRVTLVDPETGRKQTISTGLPLGVLDLPGMPPGIFPTGLAATEDGALLLSSDVEGGILRLRAP